MDYLLINEFGFPSVTNNLTEDMLDAFYDEAIQVFDLNTETQLIDVTDDGTLVWEPVAQFNDDFWEEGEDE